MCWIRNRRPSPRSSLSPCRVAFLAGVATLAGAILSGIHPLAAQDPLESLPDAIQQADVADPLPAKALPDERVEDRMIATANFAQGRLLFRREQFGRSLRRYQRAFRYANGSPTMLAEIVPLAFRLGRLDEAARYAQRATAETQLDAFLLRRLALYMTEQDDFRAALRLYDLANEVEAAQEGGDDPAEANLITGFERGRLLYLTGDFARAAEQFESVLEVLGQPEPRPGNVPAMEALRQESVVTYSLMAETFLQAGNCARAEELFRRAYEGQDEAVILDFHLARVAEKLPDLELAWSRLEPYLKSGDTQAGTAPYELLVRLLEQTNRKETVSDELARLRADQPNNVFLIFFQGQRLLEAGQADEALAAFQDLMEVRPLVDGYRGLARAYLLKRSAQPLILLLADAATRLGGLDLLDDVLSEMAQDVAWTQHLADVARQEFLSPSASLPEVGQRSVALVLARLSAESGQDAAADEFFERAAGRGEQADVGVWLTWGMHLLLNERAGRAASLFGELLEQPLEDAQIGPVYFYRAAALALDQRFDEALAAAQEAARREPDVPTIQLRPAWVLFLAKRWPEAGAEYEAFLTRFGDQYDPPVLRETVRKAKSSLSSVAVFQGRLEAAEEWLEQILDEWPGDIGALNDLGYLWADRGAHLQRARRMTQLAVEAEPENFAYRDSYGWALYKLGEYAAAVTELRYAASAEPPDAVVLDHLGDALLKSEGPEAARTVWQQALQAVGDASDQRRQQIESKLKQQHPE